MLLTLLLYGYCRGVYSSRKIAAGCESGVAFRVLSGGQFPDFRTVSDFRKNHLEAFQGRFIEVLRLCREAGMVRLGHLSLDGSKYQANASRHKAMSYGRMAAAADQLEAEVQELLDRAAAVDAAEDAEYGAAVRGDELPEELRRREERLTRIKDAKTRLEERARSRARDESQRKGATEEVAAGASLRPPARYGLDRSGYRFRYRRRQTPLHPAGDLVRRAGGAVGHIDRPASGGGRAQLVRPAFLDRTGLQGPQEPGLEVGQDQANGPGARLPPLARALGGHAACLGLWHQGGRRP